MDLAWRRPALGRTSLPGHLAIVAIAGLLGLAVTRFGGITQIEPTYAGMLPEILTEDADPVHGVAANDYPVTLALVLMSADAVGDDTTASVMVDRLRVTRMERGWGTPWELDAFNDGTVNPTTTAYAVTTGMALLALSDASASTEAERAIADYWSTRLYAYSDQPTDDVWVPSSAAIIAAAVARFGYLDEAEAVFERLSEDRFRWDYSERQPIPNDLQNYVYILWAAEVAREHGVSIPWTRAAALASTSRYGEVYPTGITLTPDMANRSDSPAEVSGSGMALAFHVRYGAAAEGWRDRTVAALEEARFVPRYAAHAMLGLALWEESQRDAGVP